MENETVEISAQKIRNILIEQFNRHRQNISGPIIKSRLEIIENILTTSKMQNFIDKYAEEKKISKQIVYKKANSHLKDIASDYNPNYIASYKFILKRVFNSLFDGIVTNLNELKKLKLKSTKSPIVFIPCHKSHIDYLLLSYLLTINNMPCPLIAAGKNLSFWPLGNIFRKGGAFFLRRTFKGATLYSKVFSEYMEKILKEGFNVEFFIEGGRSRTGKLLPPKLGILSFLLKAYQNGACEDLIFIPVYIGYDRILEEKSYVKEVKGGFKNSENLKQIIKTSKFLRKKKYSKKYGKIYINYHKPISLKYYLSKNGINISELSKTSFQTLCKNLGYKFINAIDSNTIITPYAIFAATILNQSKSFFKYEELLDIFNFYLRIFENKRDKFADTLKEDHISAFENIFLIYKKRKFIKKDKESDNKKQNELEILYHVNDASRSRIEYYKNNAITFFIPFVFTALAILDKINKFEKFNSNDLLITYKKLSFIFSNEFFHKQNKDFKCFIDESLDLFVKEKIIKKYDENNYTISDDNNGVSKLKLLAFFIKSYLESYKVVFEYTILSYKKKSIPEKDKIKKINSFGERMFERHIIDLRESISKINYKNALNFLNKNNLVKKEAKEELELLKEFISENIKLLK